LRGFYRWDPSNHSGLWGRVLDRRGTPITKSQNTTTPTRKTTDFLREEKKGFANIRPRRNACKKAIQEEQKGGGPSYQISKRDKGGKGGTPQE